MASKSRAWACYLVACAAPLLVAGLTLSVNDLIRRYVVPPGAAVQMALWLNGPLAAVASACAVVLAGRPGVAARVPLAVAFGAFAFFAARAFAVGGMAAIYGS